MQIPPLGIVGGAAALPSAQQQTEVDRARHDGANHARQASADRSAENAAGIGQTDNDEPTSDRDADGRRLWEAPPAGKPPSDDEHAAAPPTAKDPTGASGSQLDLSG